MKRGGRRKRDKRGNKKNKRKGGREYKTGPATMTSRAEHTGE